ncbi:MAG: hypothetical protein CSA75_04995 [Sorangium cellulosum]|nr:MAG: hypothetical protein CSA75_04995 [Sorangium cellulosum]
MAALIAMAFCEGPRRKVRIVVSMGCALTLLTTQAWVSVVGLLMVLLLFGKGLEKLPTVVPVTTAALAVTVFSHVVFFGGGRYALVLFPLLTVLAGGLRSVDEAEATPPIGDNQTH